MMTDMANRIHAINNVPDTEVAELADDFRTEGADEALTARQPNGQWTVEARFAPGDPAVRLRSATEQATAEQTR